MEIMIPGTSHKMYSVDHVFTRGDVLSLRVGDCLTNVFGDITPITSIYAQENAVDGTAFCCFYQAYGENATMSNSVSEGEAIHTL
jgi:hypothetical protein